MIPREYISDAPHMVKQCEHMVVEPKNQMIDLGYSVVGVRTNRVNAIIFTLQLLNVEENVLGEFRLAGSEQVENYVKYELERWIADRQWE